MGERYPGMVKFITCPVCGEQVRLICNRMWQWEGRCPSCAKLIIE